MRSSEVEEEEDEREESKIAIHVVDVMLVSV